MWEEIESIHATVYTTYGIQRHVKNQRSIGRIDDGAEQVGNLNSSDRGEHRRRKSLTWDSGKGHDRKCYESGGVWHFARQCPTRQNRLNPRNPTSNESGNAPQGSSATLSQGDLRRPKGQKNDPAVGTRVRRGSGDSSFHITVRENPVDYLAVRARLIARATTILATISGFHRVFIVDIPYPTWSLFQRNQGHQFTSFWFDRQWTGNKGSTGSRVPS
jgi:hypothetical protein